MITCRVPSVFFLLGWLVNPVASSGEALISREADGGVQVQSQTYTATFTAEGHWSSFRIGDVEMFGAERNVKEAGREPGVGAPWPGKNPPTSMNLRDQLLAIRNEQVMVEYVFGPTGIDIETSGAALRIYPSRDVTAFVQADGGVVEGGKARAFGDTRRVIVGEAAFALNQPYHFHSMHGGLYPSALARGKSPEDTFKVRIEAGVSPDPADLVEIQAFDVTERDSKLAPQFAKGETPVYEVELKNVGAKEATVDVGYVVRDAFVNGRVTAEKRLPSVTLAGGGTRRIPVEIPVSEPGCHWIDLELRRGEEVLQRSRRAFVYDAAGYRPELTRPEDFRAFWQGHLAAMRKIPMEPVLEEDADRSTEAAVHYRVTFKDPNGQKRSFDLHVPRGEGPFDAQFQNGLPQKADNANRILLGLPHGEWPEQATYNHWNSEADNNHFHCYRLAVRLTDYLRSRPDVARIHLSGASRQGPIQLVNAAHDPDRIASVVSHVPTSLGLSLTYPYRGWGRVPDPRAMAIYVDPLNFAPDMTVPFVIDMGLMDGLSPAPGALAFYNHAEKVIWKRLGLEEGGHGYFTSGFREQATRELNAFIKAALEGTVDEAILREH